MGNCQRCKLLLIGSQITLDPEMFLEESPSLTHHHLSVSKLKQLLKSLVRPEFRDLRISLVPPVTESLVNALTKGHKVQFKAVVKHKLKLRIKVALKEGKLAVLHFAEQNCTVNDITSHLSSRLKIPASHFNVIFGRVKLSPDDLLESYTVARSLKLTVVAAESEVDLASSSFDQAWQLYGVGLNYEAECTNQYCHAYQQVVVIHKGYGQFQLKEDELMGESCPICRKPAVLRAYGVLSCHYTFRASSVWDNTTGSDMTFERLQNFNQILGSPTISVFRIQKTAADLSKFAG
jgi:hypothetical protein